MPPCLLAALIAVTSVLVMSLSAWLRPWGESADTSDRGSGAGHTSSANRAASANIEKLRQYFHLAKDVLEQAHRDEIAGDTAKAVKHYWLGDTIIREALELEVPSVGLGPAFSNTARWQADLAAWLPLLTTRLQALQGEGWGSPPRTSVPSATAAEGWAALRQARAHRAQSHPQRPASASRPSVAAGNARQVVHGATPISAAVGSGVMGPKLTAEEARLQETVLGEVLQQGGSVKWADVAGLPSAKQALQEMVILPALRADLFRGLRAPARGLLLYGPPGNGKTLLAKALASEARATFFSISASSLTSKWHGEGEKLVRMLFRVARSMQPSIIFVDEIDSILSERSSGEHEASRRFKTEFLLQFDGVRSDQSSDAVVIIGATNRPWDLDEAMRRRLQKRIYIPLPDGDARRALLLNLLEGQPSRLSDADVERIVRGTEGYSGSDLAGLCREAAMMPLRELGAALERVAADRVRPLALPDFSAALASAKPSVGRQQLQAFEDWTRQYGSS